MAMYKNGAYLQQSQDAVFDTDHKPGGTTPHSAIYRYMGCGRELVSERSKRFPPQNHHQHTPAQGHISWRIIVYADHDPQ
jgi:hypothetical protein